jgi:acetylornithine deacetylase
MNDTVNKCIDQLKDEIIETLKGLVKIPSVVGKEGEAQVFVARLYQDLGLEVKEMEVEKNKIKSHQAFCDAGRPYENRPNVIGILKGNPNKNSIILNAHVDVVTPEPLDQWQHDPWGGEVIDNRMYGRGAADDKSGLVANFFALKALKMAGIDPGGTVMLQSVIEEEEGGAGTLACLMEGYTADGMIVTEPSPWINIALAGIIMCEIKVKGKAAHPAQSHLGINAISKMIPIYQALEKLDAQRKAEVKFDLFETDGAPACHLVIGTFKAGDIITKVAGEAEIGCRIGIVPGENFEDMKNTLETLVSQIAEKDPWLSEHRPTIHWRDFQAEPYYLDPEHAFVKSVTNSIQNYSEIKTEVKPVGVPWTEDTRFSQYFGFPALSFGAKGGSFHGVDEFVEIDSVVETAKAIAAATLDWCAMER